MPAETASSYCHSWSAAHIASSTPAESPAATRARYSWANPAGSPSASGTSGTSGASGASGTSGALAFGGGIGTSGWPPSPPSSSSRLRGSLSLELSSESSSTRNPGAANAVTAKTPSSSTRTPPTTAIHTPARGPGGGPSWGGGCGGFG